MLVQYAPEFDVQPAKIEGDTEALCDAVLKFGLPHLAKLAGAQINDADEYSIELGVNGSTAMFTIYRVLQNYRASGQHVLLAAGNKYVVAEIEGEAVSFIPHVFVDERSNTEPDIDASILSVLIHYNTSRP